MNLTYDAAGRHGFTWSQDVIHLINATVVEGLPRDTQVLAQQAAGVLVRAALPGVEGSQK